MSAKHTPGPLTVKIDKQWPFNINTFDANGLLIFVDRLPCHSTEDKTLKQAMACVHYDKDGREGYSAMNHRALADAVLRAAAPDLLEELDACLGTLEVCFPDAPVDSVIGKNIVNARIAVAKATGETP